MRKLLLFFLIFICGFTQNLSLPLVYKNQEIKGWLASEKLDGVRGYWDGKRLYSKNKKPLNAPEFFTKNFPPFALDGELWNKRQNFENIVSMVRSNNKKDWQELTFNIFDVHLEKTPFKKRIEIAKEWFKNHPNPYAKIIKQTTIRSKKQLEELMKQVLAKKGEGLVLRNPNSFYEAGRSKSFLKYKPFLDDEAKVVGYKISKKSKFKGLVGSLKMKNKEGKIFYIGTGLKNADRKNPPKIGEIITYKYQGKTKNNIPKFPSFLRVKKDYDWSENVQQ